MKLLSMKLTNFKGIRDADFQFPDGGNYNIYGTNGAGKTTTVDALTWLLFDKDSTDAKDFGIKTIVDGVPLHHAEHSVECVFLMEDGQTVTLKKVYKEKWQQPRGKMEAEFAGHTTGYFIDEVPKSQTEYKKFIGQVVGDEKRFKTLTSPLYFNEKLKDAERRAILMDIIGGVDQNVVIAENLDDLAGLKPLLKGRKVEDFRLVVKQSLSKIKKEVDDIEPAIKAIQSIMIAGADASNQGFYQESLEQSTREAETLAQEIAKVKAGTVDTELEKKKAEINKKLWQARDDEAKANRAAKEKLQKRVDEAAADRLNAENVVYGWDRTIKDLEQEVNSCNRTREQLITAFNNAKKQTFKAEPIESKCPYCGQDIPADKVEAATLKQEEAEKKFNLKRAELLKQINEDGIKNNEAKEVAQQKLTTAAHNRESAVTNLDVKKALEESAKRDLATLPKYVNPDVERLEKELAELEAQANRPDEATEKRIVELAAKRETKIEKQREARSKLNDIEHNRTCQSKIRELQEKEKELSATFTALTKQLWLCDQYSRCLTDHIDRKVGEHFALARFVMFKDNISNEGVKECCEVQLHGKPYRDLCQTEQMHVGLDIINTLCRYYKMTMPVLIDRSESFITLPETDMQIIRLIVSADDKELRVEKA